MQGAVSKKRLYEEQLVRLIAKLAVMESISYAADPEFDIDEFLNENFDRIVKDALET